MTGTASTRILYSSCAYLEAKSIHVLGLFRVAAKESDVMSLRQEVEGSPTAEHAKIYECHSPHVVAGLAAKYLRQLPVPLIPLYRIQFPEERDSGELTNVISSLTSHTLTVSRRQPQSSMHDI